MENWKPVKGYDELYEVSDIGRVRSLCAKQSMYLRILTQHIDKYGYLSVRLFYEGRRKRFSVHRLVAQAFIPNPNNLPQVNHKDEDKTNNAAGNLEWCDAKYNCNYGTRNHRMGMAHKGKLVSKNTRHRLSKSLIGKAVGKHWWNNGITCTMSKNCPGQNWVRGRILWHTRKNT